MSPPFLYPPLESPFVAALSAVTVVLGASIGASELRGENMAYSKFSRGAAAGALLLPSRAGMLVAYTPALVAVLASFAVPGAADDGPRARVLAAALAVHFLKRVLEVLYVHRYSGSTPLASVLTISTGYLLNSVMSLYVQNLHRGLPDPAVNLLVPGVLVFAVGATCNLYHHYLLSRLRAGGDEDGKGYRVPRGGMFALVACPHYLFEIVAFLGLAMIAQTVFALAWAFSTAAYLAGRSCATRRWYASKFDEFPARIKALVPYVL